MYYCFFLSQINILFFTVGDVLCNCAFSYEKSNTHRFEVPRMLFEDPEQLGRYIVDSNDA